MRRERGDVDELSEDVFLCELLTLAAHFEKCGKSRASSCSSPQQEAVKRGWVSKPTLPLILSAQLTVSVETCAFRIRNFGHED
jgi:hypothetical protein